MDFYLNPVFPGKQALLSHENALICPVIKNRNLVTLRQHINLSRYHEKTSHYPVITKWLFCDLEITEWKTIVATTAALSSCSSQLPYLCTFTVPDILLLIMFISFSLYLPPFHPCLVQLTLCLPLTPSPFSPSPSLPPPCVSFSDWPVPSDSRPPLSLDLAEVFVC